MGFILCCAIKLMEDLNSARDPMVDAIIEVDFSFSLSLVEE